MALSELSVVHQRRAQPTGSKREARTEAILRAVLEEIAEVGYGALSVEEVATRVGVAKTTIYRRYPTKLELVRTAIAHYLAEALGEPPNTGSLRGDLIALGRSAVQLGSSVLGQSLFRTKLLGRIDPELEELGKHFEAERLEQQRVVALRAIERGELQNEDDFHRAVQLLSGSILVMMLVHCRPFDELEIARTVDLLLHGLCHAPARYRAGAR
ncbi:MAG TPA: TetR/AcrR family transcriptional regulator [Polyangiaceae bacterium]|nr:TetR/AcrR family transcriptional regulator [Polyangiaceae bacterium]